MKYIQLFALLAPCFCVPAEAANEYMFLPLVSIEMLCSYDIRPVDINDELHSFYTKILPTELFQSITVDGWATINGKENVSPDIACDSTRTLMTITTHGYVLLNSTPTDAVGFFNTSSLVEEIFETSVNSSALREHFGRYVCFPQDMVMWNAVVNDNTFTTTQDGRLICPADNDKLSGGVIFGIIVAGLVAAGAILLVWRQTSNNSNSSAN